MLYVEGLKHNLLSISQLCDKSFKVCFDAHACHAIDSNTNQVIYIGKGMKLCMSFILMRSNFIMNHVWLLMMWMVVGCGIEDYDMLVWKHLISLCKMI